MTDSEQPDFDRFLANVRAKTSKVLRVAARDVVALVKITYVETNAAVKEVVDLSRRDPRKPA